LSNLFDVGAPHAFGERRLLLDPTTGEPQ